MTAPAVQPSSAPASSATELEKDLGHLFGDYSDSGESPDPDPASAAGTTPAEPAPGAEHETGSEPAPTGDAGATAASDGTTPATPSDTAADPQDPFADTTPATFMVNGQPVTSEDIRVFKEGGAVIRPEALPNVLQKLSERESLQGRLHTQSTEYQALNKAAEWTDPSTNTTYSGPEAVIEMRVGNANLFAENQLMTQTFLGPDVDLTPYLVTVKAPNGQDRIVVSPDVVAQLRRENSLNQRELAGKIREHYKGVVSEASKPQPAPVDYSAASKEFVGQIAKTANLDASILTPADHQLLAKQLPFHTKDGKISLDWQDLVTDRIKLRAEHKASTQTIAKTTADATKDGLARMAAAARGLRQPVRPAAPAAPKPASPQTERASNEGALFDAMERAGAAAIRRSA